MAYDKISIEAQCVEIIESEKLTFFDDLAIYVAPARSTLYEWELDKSDKIKNALHKNRVAAKKKMRCKWQESDSAPLQIAAYKLIASDEELEKLTVNKVDAKVDGSLSITWNEERTYETK